MLHLQCVRHGSKDLQNSCFQILCGWIYFHLFIVKCQRHTKYGQTLGVAGVKQDCKLLYTSLEQEFQLGREGKRPLPLLSMLSRILLEIPTCGQHDLT